MYKTFKDWKNKAESNFYELGLIIGARPKLWLVVCFVVLGLFATQIINITRDTSFEGFLSENDPAAGEYEQLKDLFGRDDFFIVSLEVGDIHEQSFIDQFRALHHQIFDEVPYVASVDSLANARHTYGKDDTLYIEELLPESLPEDPIDLSRLKTYTQDGSSYTNFLISEDQSMLAIIIRLDAYLYEKDAHGNSLRRNLEESHMRESLTKLKSIVDQYRGRISDDIRISGSIPISLLLGEIYARDFVVFTVLGNLLIAIVLYVIFRRVSAVVMPLLTMMLGITTTMSFMAIMKEPLQMGTSIIPSFLLAVCVGDSIHLLTVFYRYYDAGQDKIVALAGAMEHTGLPMFFTSITTAAGLASFAASELTPVAALGTYGAFGSLVAFLLTILVLPSLIAAVPLKRRPMKEEKNSLSVLLAWSARTSTNNPKVISCIGVLLLVGAAALAMQNKLSHLPLDWLPKEDSNLQALRQFEERMGSIIAIEVMLDTGQAQGVLNAEFLQALDDALQEIETWKTENIEVNKVVSIIDLLKETNRALHNNDEAYFSVPDNSELISQELLMVELGQPDDVFQFIDHEKRVARVSFMLPWRDSVYSRVLMERLEVYLNEKLGEYTEKVTVTGITSVLAATFAKMLFSIVESYGIAAIVITSMMILLVGSIKFGLISMIPSLLPIVTVLAIMQLTGTRLDVLTMLVGSIAIGLTVDDNVHFMHGFKKYYRLSGDPALAVEKTLMSSGPAMLITSIVLVVGFLIYTQSLMSNLKTFGLMTAACICLALLATFFLAPALMMLTNPRLDIQKTEDQEITLKRAA